jgi:hypothetical protein
MIPLFSSLGWMRKLLMGMYPSPICKEHTFSESKHPLKIPCRLHDPPYNPAANNQTEGEFMALSQTAETNDNDTGRAQRPVKTFKHGGLEVSVWKNSTEKGDMYNTTIRNSYRDDVSGEWKETASLSPSDLAVLSQLSGQAFQAITELKSQSRGR